MVAHKYDNFDDAFNDLKNGFDEVKQYVEWSFLNTQFASAEWDCSCGGTSIGALCWAIDCLSIAMRHLTDCTETRWYKSHLYEAIYYAGQAGEAPPEYELTWRKICEALAKDDFEGRYWTIAIIDHMRTLIWNKPFNIIWASKPETE